MYSTSDACERVPSGSLTASRTTFALIPWLTHISRLFCSLMQEYRCTNICTAHYLNHLGISSYIVFINHHITMQAWFICYEMSKYRRAD